MLLLTSTVTFLFQLKLNPTVKLSGDEAIGNDHYHTWDEEQDKKQQDIPERKSRGEKQINKLNEREVNQ